MARIRSIKPSFATDEKINQLSDSCALFFILLWNHCDDEGKITNSPKQISLLLPKWRSQEVAKFTSTLLRAGLLLSSRRLDWVLVAGWEHQRINRKLEPKVKSSEIEWLTHQEYLQLTEPSVNDQCKDRIGKDRIGKDRISSRTGSVEPPGELVLFEPEVETKSRPKKSPAVTSELFKAFDEAIQERYGNNASVGDCAMLRSQMKQFINRVGADDAPDIARFYVRHNYFQYVTANHSFSLLLRDYHKIRTEWKTGHTVTAAAALQLDRKQSNFSVVEQLVAEAEQMQREKQNASRGN